MKTFKIKKLLATILFLSMLLSNFYVVSKALINSLDTSPVISSVLSEKISLNPNETIKTIIWLDDIDFESYVNQALNKIPNYQEDMQRINSSGTTTQEDMERLDYFISVKRNEMKKLFSAYTKAFTDLYINSEEIVLL